MAEKADISQRLERSIHELARLETMQIMSSAEGIYHETVTRLVAEDPKLSKSRMMSHDEMADVVSHWHIKYSESKMESSPTEGDDFLDTVYGDVELNIKQRLETFGSCRPYAEFLEKQSIAVVAKRLKGLTLAVWDSESDTVIVNKDRSDGTVWKLEALGFSRERAAEILTLRLLPCIVHEIRHGLTDFDLRTILGGTLALPTAEDEALSRIHEIPVIEELDIIDLGFERPGLLVRWHDCSKLDDYDPENPAAYIKYWLSHHSKLLSFCSSSDKEVIKRLEKDRDIAMAGPKLLQQRKAISDEMKEVVLQETSHRLELINSALELLEEPGKIEAVRSYFIEKFEKFGMHYPADYPLPRGAWLRRGVRSLLSKIR